MGSIYYTYDMQIKKRQLRIMQFEHDWRLGYAEKMFAGRLKFLPVQVESSNLGVVALKVRKVEVIG